MYVLDADGQPLRCDDVLVWGDWMERSRDERMIARDRDEGSDGEVVISTVFLGLDHNYYGEGPPILWETMVFNGPLNHEMQRYWSREGALIGHQEMCEKVRAALVK